MDNEQAAVYHSVLNENVYAFTDRELRDYLPPHLMPLMVWCGQSRQAVRRGWLHLINICSDFSCKVFFAIYNSDPLNNKEKNA